MKTAESILREYIQFEDVNQSETIELLPLTIIDAMDEYANQQERSYSEDNLEEAFKSGFTNCYNNNNLTFGEWFEQFSKLKNG